MSLILRVCWCRSCPAAACCRRPVCSCTVPTWSLLRPSCSCVRSRRVTAPGTGKTATVPSCWSTLGRATPTGCFCTAGPRRAAAVSLSVHEESIRRLHINYLIVCVCVSVPKCPIGMQYSECTKSCSTTCHSLNIQEVCKEECADGCTCPGNLSPSFTLSLSLY